MAGQYPSFKALTVTGLAQLSSAVVNGSVTCNALYVGTGASFIAVDYGLVNTLSRAVSSINAWMAAGTLQMLVSEAASLSTVAVELEGDVSTLTSTVASQETTIASLATQVSTDEVAIATQATEIAALQTQVGELNTSLQAVLCFMQQTFGPNGGGLAFNDGVFLAPPSPTIGSRGLPSDDAAAADAGAGAADDDASGAEGAAPAAAAAADGSNAIGSAEDGGRSSAGDCRDVPPSPAPRQQRQPLGEEADVIATRLVAADRGDGTGRREGDAAAAPTSD
jgi:uncharacterized coiled-coil protein SlyX